MTRFPPLAALVPLALILGACGEDPVGPDQRPGPAPRCSELTTTSLAPGGSVVLDATQAHGCVRLPAAGPEGAEHLYVALATDGRETADGVAAGYGIRTTAAGAVAAPPTLASPLLGRFTPEPATAEAFHAGLRMKERALSREPSVHLFGAAPPVQAVPPAVGSERRFNVCSSTKCEAFVPVDATARYVGRKVAIYLDNSVPAGGFADGDLAEIGTLFDDHLYPIDTTAFGLASDIDGNGVVAVLLTNAINDLSPRCNETRTIVLGYFYGADLLPSAEGSNRGEVFYSLVPDPANPACDISTDEALARLGPTFIHEFQHMISFNEHVLVRQGQAEDTWLNEGLSHFAEELGARLIPDATGETAFDFERGNFNNAYGYLTDVESHFLVEPGSSTGTLAERGANWLFVRWLADHFGTPSPLGSSLTKALVRTNQLGSRNVEQVTGQSFSTLVGEWQMANYLDDLPEFAPENSRLQYTSRNLREEFAALNQRSPSLYPRPFPLVPLTTPGAGFNRAGVLRAGSGLHLRVIQPPSAAAVDLQLIDSSGAVVEAAVLPRLGVVRIR